MQSVVGYGVTSGVEDVPQPVLGSINPFAPAKVYDVESGDLLLAAPSLWFHLSRFCVRRASIIGTGNQAGRESGARDEERRSGLDYCPPRFAPAALSGQFGVGRQRRFGSRPLLLKQPLGTLFPGNGKDEEAGGHQRHNRPRRQVVVEG